METLTASKAGIGPSDSNDIGIYVLNGNAAPITATMLSATETTGRPYRFIAIDLTNAVSLATDGGLINGQATWTFRNVYESVTVVSDGTNYYLQSNDAGARMERPDREVAVSGADTVEAQGTLESPYRMVGLYVKSVVVATVGTYTLAAERVSDSANLLSAATLDLTGIVANTWTSVALTGTAANRTFAALDSFMLSFVSDNLSLDAEGVIWMAVLERTS